MFGNALVAKVVQQLTICLVHKYQSTEGFHPVLPRSNLGADRAERQGAWRSLPTPNDDLDFHLASMTCIERLYEIQRRSRIIIGQRQASVEAARGKADSGVVSPGGGVPCQEKFAGLEKPTSGPVQCSLSRH